MNCPAVEGSRLGQLDSFRGLNHRMEPGGKLLVTGNCTRAAYDGPSAISALLVASFRRPAMLGGYGLR